MKSGNSVTRTYSIFLMVILFSSVVAFPANQAPIFENSFAEPNSPSTQNYKVISFNFDSFDKHIPIINDGSKIVQSENSFLELDGRTGYLVVVDNQFNEIVDLTISAWIKPDYKDGSPKFTIVSKGNAIDFFINNLPGQKHNLVFSVFDGISWHDISSHSEIPQEWTHVAASLSESTVSIFINGKLEKQSKFNLADYDQSSSLVSNADFKIGAYVNSRVNSKASDFFSGQIDSIKLMNFSLDKDQIRDLFVDYRPLDVIKKPEPVIMVPEIIPSLANLYGFIFGAGLSDSQEIEENSIQGIKLKKEDSKKKTLIGQSNPQPQQTEAEQTEAEQTEAEDENIIENDTPIFETKIQMDDLQNSINNQIETSPPVEVSPNSVGTNLGTIKIIKDSVPNSPIVFTFTRSFGSEFQLDDDPESPLQNIQQFRVASGLYSVTENNSTGFSLTSISCVDPTSNSSGDITTRTASINISGVETVTCTFVNTQDSSITLIKNVTNNNGGLAEPEDFTLYIDGLVVEQNTPIKVSPGNHTINEDEEPGYDFVSITGEGCPENLGEEFLVPAGQDIECIITNDDKTASVTLIKNVINDNGGTLEPEDFTLYLGEEEFPQNEEIDVDSGTYTISEDDVDGYSFVEITGEGCPADLGEEFTLESGQSLICTITNDDQILPPSITALQASDPDNSEPEYAAGDVIIVKFSKPTNRIDPTPGVVGLDTADLNNLFTFSQSLGTQFSGKWISSSILQITTLNASGSTPPAINELTLTVKESAGLKNAALTSNPSTSQSPLLVGNFGQKSGPQIIALVADDADKSSPELSDGDTVTIRFSEATNRPDPTPGVAGLSKSDLVDMFSNIDKLGTEFRGVYLNPSTILVTIDNPSGGTAKVGKFTITAKDSVVQIKNAAGTSLASVDVSPPLSGSFGGFVIETPISSGGKAITTAPSGLTLEFESSSSGIVTTQQSVLGENDTSSEILIGFAGQGFDIAFDGSCEEGCNVTVIADKETIEDAGITEISSIRLFHDRDGNEILDAETEALETSVSPSDPNLLALYEAGQLFEITGTVSSNSKFAIGGVVQALALASLVGGSNNPNAPQIGASSIISLGNPSEGFGGIIAEINLDSINKTYSFSPGEKILFKFNLFENQGIGYVERVALFLNFSGKDSILSNADTSVIFKKDSKLEINDPHSLIENAEFNLADATSQNFIAQFYVTFSQPMAKSNVGVDVWDLDRNSGQKTYFEVVEIIVKEQKQQLVPEWVKSNSQWWSEGLLSDDEYLQGIEFLINQGIISVQNTSTSDDLSEIPRWIRNNAGWWANDRISDIDYLNGIEYLVKLGVIKIA